MKLTKTERLNTIKVTSSNGISKFGDVLFDYVNSVFLTSSHNAGLWLSLYQSSEVLISVFFNFWGGALSDFKNRKKIIWHCDILGGIVCIALALLAPKSLFIYAILLINVTLAVLSSFRNPAYKAIFREIVYKEHINEVNSILETVKEIVQIAGPILALTVSSILGNRTALVIDGISFFISGLLIKKLTILTNPDIQKDSKKTIHQIKDGLNYLIQNKSVLTIIIFSSVVNFVVAGYDLCLPFSTYAFPNYQIKTYAIFLTAEAIGGLLGASLSTFIKKSPTINLLIGLILLAGLALLPSKQIFNIFHSSYLVSACIIAFNFFIAIYNIQFITFVQLQTDINYIGRVFGIIFSLAILFAPIGTFFFQFTFNLKAASNYMIIGILLILFSIIALITSKILLKK